MGSSMSAMADIPSAALWMLWPHITLGASWCPAGGQADTLNKSASGLTLNRFKALIWRCPRIYRKKNDCPIVHYPSYTAFPATIPIRFHLNKLQLTNISQGNHTHGVQKSILIPPRNTANFRSSPAPALL